MLTESTILELRTLASTKPESAAALADLERTITAQALVIRNLTSELRNRRVSQAHMDALVSHVALTSVIGPAAKQDFTLAQAQRAAAELVDAASRSRSTTAILTTLVHLVRVFL